MKILQLTKRYPPDPMVGGAEINSYKISQRLEKKGHRVTVATSKYVGNHKENVHSFKALSYMDRGYFMPSLIPFIIKNEFDVIHMHVYGLFCCDQIVLLKKMLMLKTPVILQTQFHPPEHKKTRCLYDNLIGRLTLKSVDRIISASLIEKQFFAKFGIDEKIVVIPNGIDYKKFNRTDGRALRKKCPSIKENLLLYAGRLDRLKGVLDLVKMLPAVLSEYPETTLALVGKDFGEKVRLKELAGKLGISNNVIIAEMAGEEELVDWYLASDIFLMPSRYEAWCIACTEAQAAGVPVVAANVGGIPYNVIENETGLLYESENIDQLSEKVLKLLSDKELGDRLGRNGREMAKKYDWPKIIDSIERVYEEVTE